MKILGIETSCDETAAAVVEDGTKVLSNVIASQIKLHAKTGGVVPEVASRMHVEKIIPVIEEALLKAQTDLDEIDAIAVTKEPGLIVCLLVGINTAATLALIKKKPLIQVNHIEGHVYSNWLRGRDKGQGIRDKGKIKNQKLVPSMTEGSKTCPEYDRGIKNITFPVVILTASGGHNELILMKGHGDFEVLGSTRDDAAGEAFDKVARLLNLGYPGGPVISKIALQGKSDKYKLPRAWLFKDSRNEAMPRSYSFDFSFSGLKSAVLRLIAENKDKIDDPKFVADVAASFQESVCDVLSAKLILAAEKFKAKEIHLAGGVSANLRLREMIESRMKENLSKNVVFRYPKSFSYCTDNAAMIAAAGYFRFHKTPRPIKSFSALKKD